MSGNEYALQTTWNVAGTPQEVYDIVSDADGLAQWWPSGFLRVDVVDQGDAAGVGKTLAVITKGWLPYTIDWSQRVISLDPPRGFEIEVWGDFDGRGSWRFEPTPHGCAVSFDWRIRADKAVLRYGSPVIKPVFAWNHRWVMERGRESLELELLRRRATGDAERAIVPPPPGPVWPHRRAATRPSAVRATG